jgi:hypothetical protein
MWRPWLMALTLVIGVSTSQALELTVVRVPSRTTLRLRLNPSGRLLLKERRIPVEIAAPVTISRRRQVVTVQGYVACLDLPEPRPQRCGVLRDAAAGYGARVESMVLPVTRQVRRLLGQTESRTQTLGLPLTRLGARLCAKLGALPVQVHSQTGAGNSSTERTMLECTR